VVVGEGVVDRSQVEVVSVRDGLRVGAVVLDEFLQEPNGESAALDVGFVVDVGIVTRHDPITRLWHTSR
jgi:hypothetical protein